MRSIQLSYREEFWRITTLSSEAVPTVPYQAAMAIFDLLPFVELGGFEHDGLRNHHNKKFDKKITQAPLIWLRTHMQGQLPASLSPLCPVFWFESLLLFIRRLTGSWHATYTINTSYDDASNTWRRIEVSIPIQMYNTFSRRFPSPSGLILQWRYFVLRSDPGCNVPQNLA